jgi:hypothetical protein
MDEFARLMRARGIDQRYLVKRFRSSFGDGVSDVRGFFERAFQRRSDLMVPYRSVLEFYQREIGAVQDAEGRERRCACGCGQRLFGRRKWASAECRQRGYRRRVGDRANCPKEAADFLARTVTKSAKTSSPLSRLRNVTPRLPAGSGAA